MISVPAFEPPPPLLLLLLVFALPPPLLLVFVAPPSPALPLELPPAPALPLLDAACVPFDVPPSSHAIGVAAQTKIPKPKVIRDKLRRFIAAFNGNQRRPSRPWDVPSLPIAPVVNVLNGVQANYPRLREAQRRCMLQ